ncbi:MAG: hypothetical protein IT204_04925 [Fimbriimonadaceae bacterium]|nr:hypothetical protein [Fimbriimonadaceae bacterium]
MRYLMLLCATCLVAATWPLPAQEQGPDRAAGKAAEAPPPAGREAGKRPDRPAREPANRPGDRLPEPLRKLIELASLLGIVIALPFALASLLALRWAVSLVVAATWPDRTRRGAAWLLRRPWLCVGWGALLGLCGLALLHVVGQLGPGGQLPAILLAGGLVLAGAIGSTSLCEALGERLVELRGELSADRYRRLTLGSWLLMPLLISPLGWILAPFLITASLGAWRLGGSAPLGEGGV